MPSHDTTPYEAAFTPHYTKPAAPPILTPGARLDRDPAVPAGLMERVDRLERAVMLQHDALSKLFGFLQQRYPDV